MKLYNNNQFWEQIKYFKLNHFEIKEFLISFKLILRKSAIYKNKSIQNKKELNNIAENIKTIKIEMKENEYNQLNKNTKIIIYSTIIKKKFINFFLDINENLYDYLFSEDVDEFCQILEDYKDLLFYKVDVKKLLNQNLKDFHSKLLNHYKFFINDLSYGSLKYTFLTNYLIHNQDEILLKITEIKDILLNLKKLKNSLKGIKWKSFITNPVFYFFNTIFKVLLDSVKFNISNLNEFFIIFERYINLLYELNKKNFKNLKEFFKDFKFFFNGVKNYEFLKIKELFIFNLQRVLKRTNRYIKKINLFKFITREELDTLILLLKTFEIHKLFSPDKIFEFSILIAQIHQIFNDLDFKEKYTNEVKNRIGNIKNFFTFLIEFIRSFLNEENDNLDEVQYDLKNLKYYKEKINKIRNKIAHLNQYKSVTLKRIMLKYFSLKYDFLKHNIIYWQLMFLIIIFQYYRFFQIFNFIIKTYIIKKINS
ncbi:MAG: hypothetical protein ACTSPQ_10310 [Candidatus Helarchaeota archaeon]